MRSFQLRNFLFLSSSTFVSGSVLEEAGGFAGAEGKDILEKSVADCRYACEPTPAIPPRFEKLEVSRLIAIFFK